MAGGKHHKPLGIWPARTLIHMPRRTSENAMTFLDALVKVLVQESSNYPLNMV